MNEEVRLAIEEFRLRPPGKTWLIPIRFDDGKLPEWELDVGRTLNELNYSDLFGEQYAEEVAKLVTRIGRLIGEKQINPATALAAVEQATEIDRPAILKRMTKEMLLDPTRRIELDDLVGQEVQRITTAMNDEDRFPIHALSGSTQTEQLAAIVRVAEQYWVLAEPFCHSLRVAARWADSETLAPWAAGIRTLVAIATKSQSGITALLNLRHLPAVVAIMTAALSCAASGRWANLKALVVDPTIKEAHANRMQPLIECTDLHRMFAGTELVAHALLRSKLSGDDAETTVTNILENRARKFLTPEADWLFTVLQPVFADQFADKDVFEAEFDRTEIMLGAVSQDCINQWHAADPDNNWGGRTHWFGRSTWNSRRSPGNPVTSVIQELKSQGATWPPLQGNLFAGDVARAQQALESYKKIFDSVARDQSLR